MSTVVLDNRGAETPYAGLPSLETELTLGDLRLVLLPPGRVDARIAMRRHLIDVNLNGVEHRLAVNGDRLRTQHVPADSVSFWPRETEVAIETTNVLPGCVVEVAETTMRRWCDAAELAPDHRAGFLPYTPDPAAADLGRAAIRFLARRSGGAAKDRLTAEAFALGLAARVMARLGTADGDVDAELRSWSRRSDDRRLRRAIDWAEAHLGDPSLSVGDMAAAANLSSCHFGTIFKARLGESAYAYILRRRAEFARDLVVGTDMTLAAVAYQAGFSSQAHMTTVLRRLIGVTPGRLRAGA